MVTVSGCNCSYEDVSGLPCFLDMLATSRVYRSSHNASVEEARKNQSIGTGQQLNISLCMCMDD